MYGKIKRNGVLGIAVEESTLRLFKNWLILLSIYYLDNSEVEHSENNKSIKFIVRIKNILLNFQWWDFVYKRFLWFIEFPFKKINYHD